MGSRGSPTSAPIQEENEDPQYNGGNRANINDLQLFSSPSMPNISLGRPHLSNVAAAAAANHFVSFLAQPFASSFLTFVLVRAGSHVTASRTTAVASRSSIFNSSTVFNTSTRADG
jgi:hypothetical protein